MDMSCWQCKMFACLWKKQNNWTGRFVGAAQQPKLSSEHHNLKLETKAGI